MRTKTLLIDGMSCQHCVMELKKQLTKLDVKINDVQIGSAEIDYDDEKISQAQLEEAVKEAGFKLKN
jgi:copper chaperone CopZ